MPNIRGIYYTHPTTGEAGLWAMLANGTVIGGTDAQLNAMVPTGGNPATRVERARATIQSWMQAYFTTTRPSSEWSAADWDWIRLNPEPYCTIQGQNYVCQDSIVTIEVLSIAPLRYQITISEGASRAQFAYS